MRFLFTLIASAVRSFGHTAAAEDNSGSVIGGASAPGGKICAYFYPVYSLRRDHIFRLEELLGKGMPGLTAIARQCAEHADHNVRWMVANHPATPVWILEKLSRDESFLVRRGVMKNPRTPYDVVRELISLTEQDISDMRKSVFSMISAEENLRLEEVLRKFHAENVIPHPASLWKIRASFIDAARRAISDAYQNLANR